MTLEFSESRPWANLADLRVALIGNKDLQHRLVGDVDFISSFVSAFTLSVDNLSQGKLEQFGKTDDSASFYNDNVHEFLDQLEQRGVILKILCSYVTEVNPDHHDNINECLKSLGQLMDPIVKLLQYFVEKIIPVSIQYAQRFNSVSATEAANKWPVVEERVQSIVANGLDILLYLSNIRNHTFDTRIVSRFITCLLILIDDDTTSTLDKSSILLNKSTKLIPLILSSCDLSQNSSIVTLLTSLLKTLAKEANIIISTHLPSDVGTSATLLHQFALEDSNLPNIELNKSIVRSRVNTNLLLDLIVSVCQIFHVMHENDYEVTAVGSVVSKVTKTTSELDTTGDNASNVLLDEKIYLSLLLLLKCDDDLLGLASLNLICIYLKNLKSYSNANQVLIFQNYKKLFPRIVQMLKLEDDVSFGSSSSNLTKEASKLLFKSSESSSLYSFVSSRTTAVPPLYLYSPARILADLCSKYPILNDEIKDGKTDYKIMKQVETCSKSSHLFKLLKLIKKSSKNGTVLVDFTILLDLAPRSSKEEDMDDRLADLFYLLSVYTSINEGYRNRIINSDKQKVNLQFSQLIFDTIDNFHFLLNQNELAYKLIESKKVKNEDLAWFSKSLGVIRSLLDSKLFTNCLYLVRSLSRSVVSLRTFYVECNSMRSFITPDGEKDNSGGLITNFLRILKAFSLPDEINDFFYLLGGDQRAQVKSKKLQMINKSITISLLGNFILDFSSFRDNVLNHDSFLGCLAELYRNCETWNESKAHESKQEDVYQQNFVQLNILQVIKNYLFHETHENKRHLLGLFPLHTLIEKTLYGSKRKDGRDEWVGGDSGVDSGKEILGDGQFHQEIHQLRIKQKLAAFSILRNLTAGSPEFNYVVIQVYEFTRAKWTKYELPRYWTDYIVGNLLNLELFSSKAGGFEDDEALLEVILNDSYVSLVIAINNIENHKYTSIEKLNRQDFPKDQLLQVWLRFMELSVSDEFENKLDFNYKVSVNTNLNEIKSSIVWILINLTRYTAYQVSVEQGSVLFETVEGHRRAQNNHRLLVESDEDYVDDLEEDDPIAEAEREHQMTVQDRAKCLHEFGFGKVLSSLIKNYTYFREPGATGSIRGRVHPGGYRDRPHSQYSGETKGSENRTIRRFDIENSHDLLEKLKSANSQITGLLRNKRGVDSVPEAIRTARRKPEDTGEADGVAPEGSSSTESRERPLIRNWFPVGPDVNRGGEGFGYGSDEEMDQDDEGDDDDDDDEEDANDDEEDPTEYWVM